ncbi:hypothetical protein [Vulcanisaeta thermophila]|uniref:hypothetical protein n=1 Tax=Vulcanisaeta thermophila TaxID=867917 RepID=UPI00117C3E7E|nr:hypothetical protein [Vulcanisaeta thermophila]
MEIAYGDRDWLAIAPIHTNQLINYIIPYTMMRNGQINALAMIQNTDPPPTHAGNYGIINSTHNHQTEPMRIAR